MLYQWLHWAKWLFVSLLSRDLYTLVEQFRIYLVSVNTSTKFTSCSSSTSRDLCSLVEQFLIHIISRNMFTKFSNCKYSILRNLLFNPPLFISLHALCVHLAALLQGICMLHSIFYLQCSSPGTRPVERTRGRPGVAFCFLDSADLAILCQSCCIKNTQRCARAMEEGGWVGKAGQHIDCVQQSCNFALTVRSKKRNWERKREGRSRRSVG